MDSNIPIDIHYNKLQDWLISRRHCQQQWQGAALTIREKINNAIQDMPPVDEITQLLSGTYINYFHCLRIVELLKETESGTKNIFGRYSSQRMKDWQEIVKLYEKDDVYLAEVSQMLMRNVNYEIPALKKQISKCQQIQTDGVRKESDFATQAAELKEKFSLECRNMGIEGKKIRKELVELVKDLPSVYNRIAASTVNVQSAIDYYVLFVHFILNKNIKEDSLKLLRYVIDHGNTTMYQYKTGEKPQSVEDIVLEFSLVQDDEDLIDESKADEIDWGDTGVDEDEGIDWGNDAINDVIIEVVDDNTSKDTGVARGNDAFTILDNVETRNAFMNDLLELEAFLVQRVHEIKEDDLLSSNMFQSAPTELHVTQDDLESMLLEVRALLKQLASKRMKDLMLIRSSPRFVDRLANSLKKIIQDSEKCMASSRLMVHRRSEALEEQKQLEPKLDLIKSKTLQLKKQIEEVISKKYQDRRVNIMGEINSM